MDRAEHVVILRCCLLRFLLLAAYLRPMMNHRGRTTTLLRVRERKRGEELGRRVREIAGEREDRGDAACVRVRIYMSHEMAVV